MNESGLIDTFISTTLWFWLAFIVQQSTPIYLLEFYTLCVHDPAIPRYLIPLKTPNLINFASFNIQLYNSTVNVLVCFCMFDVYTLLKPNVTSSVVTVSWFTRYYCASSTPMLYISVMQRLCRREWNWLWIWSDDAWTNIHGIHDNGHVITACDVWPLQRIVYSLCLLL